MPSTGLIVAVSTLYLGGLFLLAYVTDRRAAANRASFIASPAVYTLSLAVYCTSWTFYGAVGSAARNGLEFLTIYLGPTVVLMGWWYLLRKLIRISRAQKITSIADFISARYGKSASLSALVTLIALLGVTPYIALQLQAVAASFEALAGGGILETDLFDLRGVFRDTGFWVAVCMAVFVILFGTRNLAADERHPGVVAAIAFESLVKLFSLCAIALFCVYGLNDGLRDMFQGALDHAAVQRLTHLPDGFEGRWVALTFLSAAAFICLPRQFQVTVLENADESHLATASWLFPLYMLLVSLFVIPIAMVGVTRLPIGANPDLYVLSVPLNAGWGNLALIAFIGGLSAATSMVIVAAIALSIMISNHWVTPLLLRLPLFDESQGDEFNKALLLVRRLTIVAIMTLGFTYYHVTGTTSPLASIGLISFVGVAQFLPTLIGGIYWKGATKAGAICGLLAGFFLWTYTLLVPSFAGAGWGFMDVMVSGPFGLAFLKPAALFGFADWDPIVHGFFWSLSVNCATFVFVSVLTRQSPLERLQSILFVDAFERRSGEVSGALLSSATTDDLFQLAQRILGRAGARRIFRLYREQRAIKTIPALPEPEFIAYVERQLASSVGAASASRLISRIAKGEAVSLDAVISLLDETKEIVRYSRELERKSKELEETADKLRQANEQLTRMDRMKDDFLSRVSHELRTPMTSICSFSELLVTQSELKDEEVRRFLNIIRQESARLTRLLDEILDLNRMESDQVEWILGKVDAAEVVRDAIETMRGLADVNSVKLIDELGTRTALVVADADRLKQVFVNLLSNAVKFNDSVTPHVRIQWGPSGANGMIEILVRDNGPGIPEAERTSLFTKFSRGWTGSTVRRTGAGLGLVISRQIVEKLGGTLVYAGPDKPGAVFSVKLRQAASV